jgi:hypothetical protein
MEAICSSETSVDFRRNLHDHRYENFNTYVVPGTFNKKVQKPYINITVLEHISYFKFSAFV